MIVSLKTLRILLTKAINQNDLFEKTHENWFITYNFKFYVFF